MQNSANQSRLMHDNESNTDESDTDDPELKSSSNKYLLYIGNLDTDELDTADINTLINCYAPIKSNENKINSLKVYKDSVYVDFKDEKDAQDAQKFFKNFTFRTYKLESCLIDRYDQNILSSSESSGEEEEDEIDNSRDNYFRRNNYDCEILAVNRQLKKYAESINDKLSKDLFGLDTQIKYLNNDFQNETSSNTRVPLEMLEESIDKNLLYLIFVNQSNEQFNSVNLFVFNKWKFNKNNHKNNSSRSNSNSILIKENKNIPLNKAIEQLKSDFYDYISHLKQTNRLRKNNIEEKSLENKKLINLLIKNGVDHRNFNLINLELLISRLGNKKKNYLSKYITSNKPNQAQNVPSQQKPNTSMNPSQIMPLQQSPFISANMISQMPQLFANNLMPPFPLAPVLNPQQFQAHSSAQASSIGINANPTNNLPPSLMSRVNPTNHVQTNNGAVGNQNTSTPSLMSVLTTNFYHNNNQPNSNPSNLQINNNNNYHNKYKRF